MQKIEQNSLHLLTPEDRNHCDLLFAAYYSYVHHVSELLDFVQIKNEAYKSLNTDADQPFMSVSKINDAIEALTETLETLTQSLIQKLEDYFENKYCLDFTSLIPDRGHADLYPVADYDHVIANITRQVGNDLLEAGKHQIRQRFLKCFYPKKLPTLNGNKISVQSFISIDEHFGDHTSLSYDNNTRLLHLLNALNLFLHDTTQLPQEVTEKLREWRGVIDLSVQQPVFPGASLKFYKNRRLDVVFSDAVTARKFWNYYMLEIIGKIINEND